MRHGPPHRLVRELYQVNWMVINCQTHNVFILASLHNIWEGVAVVAVDRHGYIHLA